MTWRELLSLIATRVRDALTVLVTGHLWTLDEHEPDPDDLSEFEQGIKDLLD